LVVRVDSHVLVDNRQSRDGVDGQGLQTDPVLIAP
jgi:hypothetical protein